MVTKPPFEAKVTMREASTIFDLLANEIIEALGNNTLSEADLRPISFDQLSESERK